ncbi:MAG: hypothetical protein AABX89_07385 [Candidatus Thermoplasmatota archaeon]
MARNLDVRIEPRKQLNGFVLALLVALAAGMAMRNLFLPLVVLLLASFGAGSATWAAWWTYARGVGKPRR